MGSKTICILASGLTLWLASLACGVNVDLGEPTSVPVSAATLVSQTLTAFTAQAAAAGVPDAPVATQEQEHSAVIPTNTPQPPAVTKDVLCYAGPGDIYEVVSAIKQGTIVKLIGKGDLSGWWVLENPIYKDPCWIMADALQLDPGFDTSGLTVYFAPTPIFNVSYSYMDSCVGWDPGFSLTNTGKVTFKSYSVSVKDIDTGTTVQSSKNAFDKTNGCVDAQAIPSLETGQSGWAYANSFVYDPAGHTLNATITLCTGTNLNGICVHQSLQFTP